MSTGGTAFPSAPHSSTYAAVHVHVHSMLKDKEMLIQGTLLTLASPVQNPGLSLQGQQEPQSAAFQVPSLSKERQIESSQKPAFSETYHPREGLSQGKQHT